MKVKFVDYPKTYLDNKGEFINIMDNILSRGDLILRRDVEEFEKNVAEFLGVKHVIALNSGTDALYIALKLAGIGKGDEVITVSNTFKSTIAVIEQCGATPVLVDIDDNYLMDLYEVKNKITSKTKAIIPVHLSGDTVDMGLLMEIAKDLIIIEDSAQAFGATTNHKGAGTSGLFGCFSFYPAKILGGFGDGGALVTNDDKLADEARDFRNHYKVQGGKWGINSRLDNVWAGILISRLRTIGTILERRQMVAKIYLKNLKELPLILPRYTTERVWQDFIIRTPKRDELFNFLKKHDIETMIPPTLPHLEMKMNFNLPKSEKCNEEFLRLPCNENLSIEQVEYVCEKIKEFYAEIL